MRPSALIFALLCLFALVPAPLAAQHVHGRVTATEGGPLEGALVVLLRGSGAVAATTLTTAAGDFAFRGVDPGDYRLRVERIGHESVEADSVAVGFRDTVYVAIAAPPHAIALEAIVAVGEARCELQSEAGAHTARLWEEARKALTATVVVAREGRLVMRAVRWERELHPTTEAVLSERARELVTLGGSLFRAVPVDQLMTRGFAVVENGQQVIYGPDAEVLLSDAFLDSHCFRVTEGRDKSLIGLGFEPLEGRTQPEIRGVLWLGRADAELKFIDYTFVNLDVPGPPGLYAGRTELGRLPDGSWAVTRWHIRSPRVVIRRSSAQLHDVVSVESLHEVGGQVVQVTAGGRPLWAPQNRK